MGSCGLGEGGLHGGTAALGYGLCDKRQQPLCPHPPADLSSPLRILPEDLVTT